MLRLSEKVVADQERVLGRIREHPAYARLQERVHEIDELKVQF